MPGRAKINPASIVNKFTTVVAITCGRKKYIFKDQKKLPESQRMESKKVNLWCYSPVIANTCWYFVLWPFIMIRFDLFACHVLQFAVV